jgi:hypothetical protein
MQCVKTWKNVQKLGFIKTRSDLALVRIAFQYDDPSSYTFSVSFTQFSEIILFYIPKTSPAYRDFMKTKFRNIEVSVRDVRAAVR